jgi:pentapeptide MXKDX repeat protein
LAARFDPAKSSAADPAKHLRTTSRASVHTSTLRKVSKHHRNIINGSEEHRPSPVIAVGTSHQRKLIMKKAILAATCAAALTAFTTAGAMAQTTGPAAQDTTKMGTEKSMSKDNMSKDGMKTQGKTQGMSKDSMSKDGMKDKSKENKPVDGMKK